MENFCVSKKNGFGLPPRVDPTKLFFSVFFFGVKLGHFTINNVFLYVTKMQAYHRKTEKFFVSECCAQLNFRSSCNHNLTLLY